MTALIILLTISVIVTSEEWSFSELKLIKAFLQLTVLWDRLKNNTILSVEMYIERELECSVIIDDDAMMKTRKVCL